MDDSDVEPDENKKILYIDGINLRGCGLSHSQPHD